MKIAVVDSGIHDGHPHVGRVAGGVGVTADRLTDDFTDRLGHGTAVAGAIREKTAADLYAVKIFDRRLSAGIDTIIRALEWCIEHEMDLINLSLGTANEAHCERFARILTPGVAVISVAGMLPGTLENAIAVAPEDCPRDTFRYRDGVFYTSPYPRPIPGVAPERNLQGASFAVANMTGFAAMALQSVSREDLRAELIRRAEGRSR